MTPSTQNPTPSVPLLDEVYFYLTEGCNLACRHCWLAPRFDADGSRYATLPLDVFETVIREAKPLGLTKVKLTGGEPLLHPGIEQLLDITRRENVAVVMETNGLLCTADLAAQIARTRMPFVSVSLDGVDAATHEWLRGVAGSFEKACDAVRDLAHAGLKPQIIMSLVRRNADQVDAMVRLAESLGAGSVKFNLVQPTERGEALHERGDTLAIAELIALGRRVDEELIGRTRLSLHFDYPMAFRPLRRIAGSRETCGILSIIGVLSTGHYALCGIGMQVPELIFGRAKIDALSDIWAWNPVLTELRTGLPGRLEGACGQCLMRYNCLGACIAQNYYRHRNLWHGYWFCEEAEKAGLFPASRKRQQNSVQRAGQPPG